MYSNRVLVKIKRVIFRNTLDTAFHNHGYIISIQIKHIKCKFEYKPNCGFKISFRKHVLVLFYFSDFFGLRICEKMSHLLEVGDRTNQGITFQNFFFSNLKNSQLFAFGAVLITVFRSLATIL